MKQPIDSKCRMCYKAEEHTKHMLWYAQHLFLLNTVLGPIKWPGVYEWSPVLTRSLGRPKNRWDDDVKSIITRMKITNWKDCIRNRTKWKKLVEKAKTSLKL
jgi:hypothetical protein